MDLEDFQRQYLLSRGFTGGNIDKSPEDLDTDNEEFKKVYQQIQAYRRKLQELALKGIGLFIVGGPGSGKTLLCQMLLRDIYLKGPTVQALNCDQLLMLSNGKWMQDSQTEYAEKVFKPFMLLIDNAPFTSHKTRTPVDVIQHVVRERYTRFQRPTIINTAVPTKEVSDVFGRDFMSFSAEAFIFIGGLQDVPDYRKQIRAARKGILDV